ncbi:MAG: hypothetical protein IBX44_10420 [Sulfurospirillum sp.]|nr:hypothetical protein [Sulfurospirillum sp.]
MTQEKQLDAVDDIAQLIFEVFGVKLDISGGWGYSHKDAVVINSLDMPADQFLNLFANLRANVAMHLTQEEHERYAGISVHFLDGEKFSIENKTFDHVRFETSAMLESDYKQVIQEYKDNYGKNKDFDMQAHFEKRKNLTIKLVTDFWFQGLKEHCSDE